MADTKLDEQQIRELTQAFSAAGLDKMANEVEARLRKGKALTKAMTKQLDEIMVKQAKQSRELIKELNKLEKAVEDWDKAGLKKIQTLKQELNQLQKNAKAVDAYNSQQEKQEEVSHRVGDALTLNISLYGALRSAISALTAVYNNWFNLQEQLTVSMGNMARQTGATASQLRANREQADQLREIFGRLRGPVDGIAASFEFVTDMSLAMRRSAGEFSRDFQLQMLAASEGLGLGAQGATELFRTLEAGLAGGDESVGNFTIRIREFADSIGANGAQMAREFIDARDSLALFGEDGERVFRDTATVANRLGFEVGRVLEMARRFDLFSSASDHVNQLNAMFGTTISSMELLMTESPTERIDMIMNAVRESGAEMDRYQRSALAQAMGVSENEVSRLMNGESFAQIQQEQEQQARRQTEMAEREGRARETILSIIEQTSTIFNSWERVLQGIMNDVSEALGPIFEAIHTSVIGTGQSLREWVRQIAQNSDFRNTIQNIANWIRELPRNIREFLPTWERIKQTAIDVYPTIQSIATTIRDMINFAIEHREAIGVALGVLAVGRLAAGLGSIVGLMGTLTGAAPGLASALAPVAAILSPLLGVGAALGAAHLAEDRRVDEGQRVRERDAGTMGRLHDTAREELQRRRGLFTSGARDAAFGGGGAFSDLREGLGLISGQEADQQRNRIESVIQDFIRPGNVPPQLAARQIGEILGPEMSAQIARAHGASSFGEYIRSLYMEDAHLRENFRSSLGLGAPTLEPAATPITPTTESSAVESAPTTDTTTSTTSASTSGSGVRVELRLADVYLDGRQIGRAHVEAAIT